MTVELKPEQERIVRRQLAAGHFASVDEVLATALAHLPQDCHFYAEDLRFNPKSRREAVRRMIEFGDRGRFSLGELVTRSFLHEDHRF